MPYVYLSDGSRIEIEQWQAEDEEYLPPSQMSERDWDKLAELFDGNTAQHVSCVNKVRKVKL